MAGHVYSRSTVTTFTKMVYYPANPSVIPAPVHHTLIYPRALRLSAIQVCREFIRGACKRPETECRYAHPLENMARNDDGSITVCMDAVKGRCSRDPCRYFHPPLHLQTQLKGSFQSGRLAITHSNHHQQHHSSNIAATANNPAIVAASAATAAAAAAVAAV